jgi:PAS domain S-box-containing protein
VRLERADCADEALRFLSHTTVAAVILNWTVPGPDGFEIARRIRARDRGQSTPVLFVCDRDLDPAVLTRAYALGAVDHVVTPVIPEILRTKLGVFAELYRITERVRRLERESVARPERAAHAIALILAEAADEPDAVHRIVRTLGEHFGWDVGGLWSVEPGRGEIRLAEWWTADAGAAPRFERASRTARFPSGVGVPGRVWSSGEPVWVADLGGDRNFPRLLAAAADGLTSGVAAPVRASGEFLGVIEYYSRRTRPPDAAVLSELAAAGTAVGHCLRRRRTEAALRESEQRFARFMSGLPGLAWLKDPDGRYVYANEAATRAFGVARNALYGRTDADLFPPETATQFQENDRRALADPRGVQVVETLRHSDGTAHHSLVSKFPVPGPDDRAAVGGMAIDITDRVRAETAVREGEARLHAVIDGMPALVYVKDRAGRYLLVNRAFAELIGTSRGLAADQIVGRTDDELFPPETAAERAAADRRVWDAGMAVQSEETFVHADGPHAYVSVKFPLRAVDGTVNGSCGVSADVEEQRRASRVLDRYRLLSQHARDIVLFIRPSDGRVVDANAAAASAYQYDHDTLLTLSIADLRGPATVPEVRPQMAAADAVGVTFETIHRRRDGSLFPVEVNSCGADVGGERLLLSIVRDVSERARAEEALRRSEVRYRRLVEESPLSIQIFAPDGSVLGANRAWEALWGGTLAEHLGDYNLRTDPQLVALGIAPAIERAFAGAAVELPPVGYTPDRGSFAGLERWVRAFLYPVKDAAGRVEEVVLIHEDITDRRRAEEALKEADRRKDEFLAMLAHELRNPLAPIRTAAQVLRLLAPTDPRLREAGDVIDRQVRHMGRLVDDLLDVARIARGKLHLRKEPLDLVGLVRQGVEDHRTAFDARGVTLTAVAPDMPVTVSGDATRLAQILDNLLTNALKFTEPDGQVTVTVAAPGPGEAALVVRDTGAGLEPELRARLFEPFSQADRTLDRTLGGLGLGLAIARGLAELHGGRIRADSPGAGQGATFTVTLPAATEPPALAAGPADAVPVSRRFRVLVVEDNRDAADSLKVLLDALGFQTEVARTGPEGVRLAGSQQPDVVVCDIGLPGMNGYAVAAALRANPATAATRLIALTGYGQEEDQRRAAEAGFDYHMTKPADPAALIRLFSHTR